MGIFHHHSLRKTNFIRLHPHECQGCWKCIEICEKDVFVKGGLGHHRHVHIRNAEACSGCKKCVRACEHGALEYTYMPKSARTAMPD